MVPKQVIGFLSLLVFTLFIGCQGSEDVNSTNLNGPAYATAQISEGGLSVEEPTAAKPPQIYIASDPSLAAFQPPQIGGSSGGSGGQITKVEGVQSSEEFQTVGFKAALSTSPSSNFARAADREIQEISVNAGTTGGTIVQEVLIGVKEGAGQARIVYTRTGDETLYYINLPDVSAGQFYNISAALPADTNFAAMEAGVTKHSLSVAEPTVFMPNARTSQNLTGQVANFTKSYTLCFYRGLYDYQESLPKMTKDVTIETGLDAIYNDSREIIVAEMALDVNGGATTPAHICQHDVVTAITNVPGNTFGFNVLYAQPPVANDSHTTFDNLNQYLRGVAAADSEIKGIQLTNGASANILNDKNSLFIAMMSPQYADAMMEVTGPDNSPADGLIEGVFPGRLCAFTDYTDSLGLAESSRQTRDAEILRANPSSPSIGYMSIAADQYNYTFLTASGLEAWVPDASQPAVNPPLGDDGRYDPSVCNDFRYRNAARDIFLKSDGSQFPAIPCLSDWDGDGICQGTGNNAPKLFGREIIALPDLDGKAVYPNLNQLAGLPAGTTSVFQDYLIISDEDVTPGDGVVNRVALFIFQDLDLATGLPIYHEHPDPNVYFPGIDAFFNQFGTAVENQLDPWDPSDVELTINEIIYHFMAVLGQDNPDFSNTDDNKFAHLTAVMGQDGSGEYKKLQWRMDITQVASGAGSRAWEVVDLNNLPGLPGYQVQAARNAKGAVLNLKGSVADTSTLEAPVTFFASEETDGLSGCTGSCAATNRIVLRDPNAPGMDFLDETDNQDDRIRLNSSKTFVKIPISYKSASGTFYNVAGIATGNTMFGGDIDDMPVDYQDQGKMGAVIHDHP